MKKTLANISLCLFIANATSLYADDENAGPDEDRPPVIFLADGRKQLLVKDDHAFYAGNGCDSDRSILKTARIVVDAAIHQRDGKDPCQIKGVKCSNGRVVVTDNSFDNSYATNVCKYFGANSSQKEVEAPVYIYKSDFAKRFDGVYVVDDQGRAVAKSYSEAANLGCPRKETE